MNLILLFLFLIIQIKLKIKENIWNITKWHVKIELIKKFN